MTNLNQDLTNWMRTAVMAVGCAFAMESAVQAIPTLQLDIDPGSYDPVKDIENSVNSGNQFNLLALLKTDSLPVGGDYRISVVLTPKTATSASLGSFLWNGQEYDVTDDMTYGRPPVAADSNPEYLQNHQDLFKSYYKEFSFSFTGSSTIAAYNVQDGASASGSLYVKTFAIDVSNLAVGYALHFDLYRVGTDGLIPNGGQNVAPFSHDAEGRRVPDAGATLSLLGCALLGIEGLRRKLGLKA